MLSAYKEGGLILVLVIVLSIISFFIIRHMLCQSDKILKMAMDMNEKWQKVIGEHTSQNKSSQERADEAHRYQREEHREMITTLTNINSDAQVKQKALEKICDNLDEQGKVLARMNGH